MHKQEHVGFHEKFPIITNIGTVVACSLDRVQRFVGTYRLHLQGRRVNQQEQFASKAQGTLASCLKM
jgi:hypothetical protein